MTEVRPAPRRIVTRVWPTAVITCFLVAVTLTTGAPPVSGGHLGTIRPVGAAVNETVVLPMNNWTAFEADVSSRDRIVYDAQVIAGSNVDFYIVSTNGMSQYLDDARFVFVAYEGFENIYSVNGVFTDVTGRIYFVVDNSDVWGVDPTGNVTVRVRIGEEPSLPLPTIVLATCVLGIGGAIAVGVGLALRHRRKRKQAEQERVEALQRLAQVRPPQSPGGPLWPPPPPPPDE